MTPRELTFSSTIHPELVRQFRPNLTPRQIFLLGSFGGTYWRPIHSQLTGKTHSRRHLKFSKKGWWDGIPNSHLTRKWNAYDKDINRYGVQCGSTLEDWEAKQWITAQDPYGWVEWYCNFFDGRRTSDDARQIKRWLAFCGPNGRFKRNIVNQIKKNSTTFDDERVSPVIRQSLQHWGYQITPADLIN